MTPVLSLDGFRESLEGIARREENPPIQPDGCIRVF
jgi:hypothetical protein